MLLPFVVGGMLALLALGFVLLPMVRGTTVMRSGGVGASDESEDAIGALREVEFDRATGKLSDDDYAALSARYRPQALAQLDRESHAVSGARGVRDPEALIAAWRDAETSCATCGPRPEAGATWCSSCGGYLPLTCPRCRASVTEDGASFCSHCGTGLIAA